MNVLFLAFEGEAHAMAHLAMRFKTGGHNVFVLSCDHFSVTHSRGEVFDYYCKVGLAESEFGNFESVYRELNGLQESLPDTAVDWNYLRTFESRYCKRFTLLELVAMDPLISGAYHHRTIYYRPCNKALLFKYLELQARYLEALFARGAFDCVFTINFQYFVKAAVFTMAHACGIPYLMVSSCRIRNLHVLYDNFSIGTPRSIVAEMRRLEEAEDPCCDSIGYFDRLRNERKPAYDAVESWDDDKRKRLSLSFRLKELWWWFTRYPRRVLFVHKHYRGILRRNYFLPSYFACVRTLIVGLWRRLEYFRCSELMRSDLPKEPFVYFPLHLIPENTVLTLSKTFDEMECIFQLAKALPADWRVVVKIKLDMLTSFDTHPNSYFMAMNRIANVQFINPLIPSAEIIDKASAVATISGTALLEGAVFGKPGFRWGRTEFDAVDTIYLFDPEKLREQLQRGVSGNLRYYVQACHNLGLRLDLGLLCQPRATMTPDQTAESEKQISCLENKILGYLAAEAKTEAKTTEAIA
jgi:hypothetical protein